MAKKCPPSPAATRYLEADGGLWQTDRGALVKSEEIINLAAAAFHRSFIAD
jgi:hypothetical protein